LAAEVLSNRSINRSHASKTNREPNKNIEPSNIPPASGNNKSNEHANDIQASEKLFLPFRPIQSNEGRTKNIEVFPFVPGLRKRGANSLDACLSMRDGKFSLVSRNQ
jgi:hypothetical protein